MYVPLGQAQIYKLLESYDEWLRGRVVDPGHNYNYQTDPGDEVPRRDRSRGGQRHNDPDDGKAVKLTTALLGVMCSPPTSISSPSLTDADDRRPRLVDRCAHARPPLVSLVVL